MIQAMQTQHQIIENPCRTMAEGTGQRSLFYKKTPLPESSEVNGHSAPREGKRALDVAAVGLGVAHGLGGFFVGGQLGRKSIGWSGNGTYRDAEQMRVLQLHFGRNTPENPIRDALDGTRPRQAQKPRKTGGATVMGNDFKISHAAIKHYVEINVNSTLKTSCLQ